MVLQLPDGEIWTVEIKSGLIVKPKKGFYHAVEDIKPDRSFVVYAGKDRYPMPQETDIISLVELVQELIDKV